MNRYAIGTAAVAKGDVYEASGGGKVMYARVLPQSRSYPMEWTDLVFMVEDIIEDPASRLRRLRAEGR